jgi:hypothetical protein
VVFTQSCVEEALASTNGLEEYWRGWEFKEHWCRPMAWMSPRSTRWPMAWLIPRSTRVDGGLVDSKEQWGGDGVKKLITSSGLHLEKCGPWIKMEGS